MSESTFRQSLASHPRVIGAAFAIVLLALQAGTALAGGAGVNPGP